MERAEAACGRPPLVAGIIFSTAQLAWSNYIGPELAAIVAGMATLVALSAFCSQWRPAVPWHFPGDRQGPAVAAAHTASRAEIVRAWIPWLILCTLVTSWGLPQTKALLNGGTSGLSSYLATKKAPAPDPMLSPVIPVPNVHRVIYRDYPVLPDAVDRSRIADPAYRASRAEAATYPFNWLSAAGTAILLTTILSGLLSGVSLPRMAVLFGHTLYRMRFSLLTIAAMLSLGYVTRYSGSDATLGLMFTRTGRLYPFFARCSAGSAWR